MPYSQNAVIDGVLSRASATREAGDWFVVTTIVEDPQYLAQPFITSSNFKKEAERLEVGPDGLPSVLIVDLGSGVALRRQPKESSMRVRIVSTLVALVAVLPAAEGVDAGPGQA